MMLLRRLFVAPFLLACWFSHQDRHACAFAFQPATVSSWNSVTHHRRHRDLANISPSTTILRSKSPLDDDACITSSDGLLSNSNAIVGQIEEFVAPAQDLLDGATGGWALTCADLTPETEETPIGQAFLATNLAYALVGALLAVQGDLFLGFLTELCSIASFCYHYTQLQGSRAADGALRLVLFMDYVFAFSTIFVAFIYILMDQQLPATDILLSTGLGLGFLFACWIWEEGITYIVLHSLWHLFSAYTGYLVGMAHLSSIA